MRGNQKQVIFAVEEDFNFYLAQLKLYKKRFDLLLYGYCLMPNHIHLIVEPLKPPLLSKLMQCLQRSYTAYYNKKYNKVGHLWQDRFKSKVITKDEYLINCISYIEQNPARAGLVKNLYAYKFSSYVERNLETGKNVKLLNKLLL